MEQPVGKTADRDTTSPRALQEDMIGFLYLVNKLFCLRVVNFEGILLQLAQNIESVLLNAHIMLPA